MPQRKRKRKPRSSDIVQRFSVRLRETRLAQGLTQLDLAAAAGISVAYVGRLEAANASCTLDIMEKIAKALAVSVADLLPMVDPPDLTAQLRERVRSLSERLAENADRETLSLAVQFLARLFDR